MPADVGQRLLHDPVKRQFDGGGQSIDFVGRFGRDRGLEAGAHREVVDERRQGGLQAELIERRRSKRAGQLLKLTRRGIQLGVHQLDVFMEVRVLLRDLAGQGLQPELDADQGLPGLVVELKRDAPPFFLEQVDVLRRQRLELATLRLDLRQQPRVVDGHARHVRERLQELDI